MTNYTVTRNEERILVSGENALAALVTGIALGLGASAEEARKRGQDARRGAVAGRTHYQWVVEETWVRIDREWERA